MARVPKGFDRVRSQGSRRVLCSFCCFLKFRRVLYARRALRGSKPFGLTLRGLGLLVCGVLGWRFEFHQSVQVWGLRFGLWGFGCGPCLRAFCSVFLVE